jgi:hypothetical protein
MPRLSKLLKPTRDTLTVYAPAVIAGKEYSPDSFVVVDREALVPSLTSVTSTPGMTPLESLTAPRRPPVKVCADAREIPTTVTRNDAKSADLRNETLRRICPSHFRLFADRMPTVTQDDRRQETRVDPNRNRIYKDSSAEYAAGVARNGMGCKREIVKSPDIFGACAGELDRSAM